jgi:hypothetical protein
MKLIIESGIFWLSGSHKQKAMIDEMRVQLEHKLDAVVAADESDDDEICLVFCYDKDAYIIDDVRWQYRKIKKELTLMKMNSLYYVYKREDAPEELITRHPVAKAYNG